MLEYYSRANHKRTQTAKANLQTANKQQSRKIKMNSKVITSSKRAYHTEANAEFTGYFEGMTYEHPTQQFGAIFDYHLFIRYEDKVYMEVKGVGEVVIPFAELQKNKYWKHYYDLSLMLSNNANAVVQELKHSSDYDDVQIYDEPRFWSIDTAFIEYSVKTETSKINNSNEQTVCYYKINPFDLEKMDYTTPEDLKTFLRIYMTRNEFRNKVFEKKSGIYNSLAIDYALRKAEKEFETIAEDNQRYYAEASAEVSAALAT